MELDVAYNEGVPEVPILGIAHLEGFQLDLAGGVVEEESSQFSAPWMVHIEDNHEDGSEKRERGPSLGQHHWDQGRVIGHQELGIGDGGGGPIHDGVKYVDKVLGFLTLGGRGLYEDEWLNAGGQVVGIGHPKFQCQYFFGKGRRHNVSAKATRETNIHGVVDGTLEHITLLCFCLGSHRPPDRAEFREMVDLGEVLQRAH
jgi:hypothetical protein